VTDLSLDSPLVQSIGWALIHFVWQGTVIGIATALTLRALAGARPAMRYAVACFSMALMLIVPVVGMLTARPSASAALWCQAVNGEFTIHCLTPSASPSASGARPINVATSVLLDRVLSSAVMAWLAGVLLLSVRLMVAWAGIERLKRATRSVDATVVARAQLLARRFGIDRSVQVFESTLVRVPTVVGYLRPVILLPASVITGLAPAYLDAVLAHELAHVRRHDYLVNALQSLVETLLFYHPAVWWCSGQIRIEREHCCDDMVVEAGSNRLAYATALAQLEELRGFEPMLSLNASGGRLVDRIRRLLGESPMKERRSTMWTIAVALAVATALVVTPARRVADASELAVSPRADSWQSNSPQVPALPSVALDASTSKDIAWSEYVRQTQAALETLAGETRGIAVFPEPPTQQPPTQTAQSQPQPPRQSQPEPPLQPAPEQPPQPPQPPMPGVVAVPPAPPGTATIAPVPPMPPTAPAPAALPALPAPPAPPLPPQEVLAFDPDSIHELMKSATQQIAESFEELRRATEEVGLKQEALRQAQAEVAKMRIETLAVRTQIEAMQKALSEFSAKTTASQFDSREMQKLIDDLSAELAKLRAR
jgi:beta-lactamase regulating signal transducer with metallopeptidase domain